MLAGPLVDELLSFPLPRVAFTEADVLGRSRAIDLMESAGMTAALDEALNVNGLWRSRDLPDGADVITLISHLDTVVTPGAYDGLLGVLAAIGVVRALRDAGCPLRHGLEVIGTSDEEGTATLGCFGSRWLLGLLNEEERASLGDPDSDLSTRLLHGRERLVGLGHSLLSSEEIRGRRRSLCLELHVEQGPLLQRRDISTAAVTGIAGIDRYLVTTSGVGGHAGTVPVDERDDALEKAATVIRSLLEAVRGGHYEAKANVGDVAVRPGSFNVIPSEVTLSIELRAPYRETLDTVGGALRSMAAGVAGRAERLTTEEPSVLDAQVREMIVDCAAREGVDCTSMASWAGHDAGYFATSVPTGMIFVPSAGGHSHNAMESSDPAAIQAGLDVLVAAVVRADEILA